MTRLLGLAAALTLTLPAVAQDTPAVKEAKDLNGSYTVKSANFNNQPAPAELLKEVTGVEIKDGVITVRTEKKDDPAKFTVDTTKQPAVIDITPEKEPGKAKPGIFKVDKGGLTIAFSDKGTRPTDFNPADGVKILVLTKKVEPKK